MKKSEQEIEFQVAEKFKEVLKGHLTVHTQEIWKTSRIFKCFDILIKSEQSNIVAVVEVKNNLSRRNSLENASKQVLSYLNVVPARFGIITDGEEYFIYENNQNGKEFKKESFDEIVKHFDLSKIKNNEKEKVVKIIINSARKFFEEKTEICNFIEKISTVENLQVDKMSKQIWFKDANYVDWTPEDHLFSKILGEFKHSEIYRYTSLQTAFEIIKNGSFRMNGLFGMNDKSEINYAENFITDKPIPFNQLPGETINALNKKFISSFSSKNDNLTMWRLYGDNGKGVMLSFSCDNQNAVNQMVLQNVDYATSNKKHKALCFIKKVVEDVEKETSMGFQFRRFDIWKHFFKPNDFDLEAEVRLLVTSDTTPRWCIAFSSSVINPFVEFDLKNLPIHINRIVLGPNCPEKEINKVQFEEMMRVKKISNSLGNDVDVKVELSKIENYR